MQRKCLKCDYNFTHCNRSENYSLLPRLEVTSSPYTQRADLTITEQDYESLWVEILGEGRQNILCGVVYRV